MDFATPFLQYLETFPMPEVISRFFAIYPEAGIPVAVLGASVFILFAVWTSGNFLRRQKAARRLKSVRRNLAKAPPGELPLYKVKRHQSAQIDIEKAMAPVMQNRNQLARSAADRMNPVTSGLSWQAQAKLDELIERGLAT